ncbi:c-type cyclin [Colletotrichum incanum]|uniref:RNA polymerase II holoenzyme cyclin-like subunit n=1 Tax=Colletotrichum incanum TaxID=1573173 RepID=A0A166ZVF0_COLIC|nr:c-type cyclin [Colletotrichum incanum]
MAKGPVPQRMTTLNRYLVPIETLVPGALDTEVLDLCAGGHSKLVRVLYRQDRSVVPPRLRLLVVTHPRWQAWLTGTPLMQLLHLLRTPTATLTEISLGVLEHWGREVSEATRRQIELLAPNHILDLPLDGNDVFCEDYSWIITPTRAAPDTIKDVGDEDDTNTDGYGNSDPTGPLWGDEGDDKTLGSDSKQTISGHSVDCDGDITMAPSGPKAQQNAVAANSTPTPAAEPAALKGPHPGHIQVACQYTSEQRLRRMLRDNKSDPAREDNYRLQGVQLIDNVRTMLHVPIKTFDTACVYYHWFRLSFRDAEYNYQDAAVAALFLACKVEDTIKKSKEILCAAYNIKNPDHTTTQDDKMFEQPSKIIIGLERLVLETVGFDFRCRYPQSALLKATKKIMGTHSKKLFTTAMDMSVDLYKTFAPIKQTSYAMALGLLELTARLLGEGVDKIDKINYANFHTTRQNVVETVLDLLDLYTQHGKSTKLGNRFDLNKFIEVKIIINNEVDNTPNLVRYAHWCNNCDGGEDENLSNGVSVLKNISFFGSNSAKRNGRNQDGTMRFVFDPEQARQERKEVEAYYRDEYEEYEVEVEVPIEPERPNHNNHRDKRHDGGGGGGWGGSNHHRRNRTKGRGYY